MTDVQAQRAALAGFDIPAFASMPPAAELIRGLPGTAEYFSLLAHFDRYPEKSQTQPSFRAVLYLMLRLLQPKWAIEIGTLFAGTAEIISSALAANGSGILTTIDPFGAHRAPGLVGEWPAEWQRHVDYRPVNSMQLFMDLAEKPERPDFVFIDGNHEYEYALFDLLNSARYLRPGGIIILDNYYDYGVRLAGDKFEAENPAWQIIKFSAHPSLGTSMTTLQLDGLYRVYVAPTIVPIGTAPRGFHQVIEGDGILGLDLKIAKPGQRGRLSYKIYLRTIPYEFHLGKGDMEEMSISGEVHFVTDGSGKFQAPLAMPLSTKRPRDGFHRRCEINLVFESENPGEPLILAEEPKPMIFNR